MGSEPLSHLSRDLPLRHASAKPANWFSERSPGMLDEKNGAFYFYFCSVRRENLALGIIVSGFFSEKRSFHGLERILWGLKMRGVLRKSCYVCGDCAAIKKCCGRRSWVNLCLNMWFFFVLEAIDSENKLNLCLLLSFETCSTAKQISDLELEIILQALQ